MCAAAPLPPLKLTNTCVQETSLPAWEDQQAWIPDPGGPAAHTHVRPRLVMALPARRACVMAASIILRLFAGAFVCGVLCCVLCCAGCVSCSWFVLLLLGAPSSVSSCQFAAVGTRMLLSFCSCTFPASSVCCVLPECFHLQVSILQLQDFFLLFFPCSFPFFSSTFPAFLVCFHLQASILRLTFLFLLFRFPFFDLLLFT